jgi:hypothetical protein
MRAFASGAEREKRAEIVSHHRTGGKHRGKSDYDKIKGLMFCLSPP